jgi:hypothetical protein
VDYRTNESVERKLTLASCNFNSPSGCNQERSNWRGKSESGSESKMRGGEEEVTHEGHVVGADSGACSSCWTRTMPAPWTPPSPSIHRSLSGGAGSEVAGDDDDGGKEQRT